MKDVTEYETCFPNVDFIVYVGEGRQKRFLTPWQIETHRRIYTEGKASFLVQRDQNVECDKPRYLQILSFCILAFVHTA